MNVDLSQVLEAADPLQDVPADLEFYNTAELIHQERVCRLLGMVVVAVEQLTEAMTRRLPELVE